MRGFFDLEEIAPPKKPAAKKVTINNCETCGRDVGYSHTYARGGSRKKILFVLDKMNAEERDGKQTWLGARAVLRKEIEKVFGDKYFWKNATATVYAVACGDAPITTAHVDACRKKLDPKTLVKDYDVVIPFGYHALRAVIGDHVPAGVMGTGIQDFIGEQIPDAELGVWVCPTWETSRIYYDNFRGERQLDEFYLRDILAHVENATALLANSFSRAAAPKINIVRDSESAITEIERMRARRGAISFDVETSGLKPYREGHLIRSLAFCDGERAVSFLNFDNERFRAAVRDFLADEKIKFVAHNGKYDALWCKRFFGVAPKIDYDTMLAAHVENNRKSVGLKLKTYIKFGTRGYGDEIAEYLESAPADKKREGAHAKNSIERAPVEKLLTYNALDSWYTYRLCMYYTARLIRQRDAVKLLTDACNAFVDAEFAGMRFDSEGARDTLALAETESESLSQTIDAEARKSGWTGTTFRPSANADARKLFFDILKLAPTKYTAGGAASVDKSALDEIQHPIAELLRMYGRNQKMRGYLENLLREECNGKINPFFQAHKVASYRTSSDSPNFQNFPKRDADVSEKIRSLLLPHVGHKLVEYDYKAIEVGTSTIFNRDPNLIAYVTDATSDMHRDTAAEILLCAKKEVTKTERQSVKGAFVFAQFYGSTWRNCAPALWKVLSDERKKYLRERGIKNYDSFEKHIESVENKFWGERFPVYKKWKREIYESFIARGYTKTPLGFRYQGFMTRTECANYQTQGTACHILLRLFVALNDHVKRLDLKSKIVGQIHDSIVVSVAPDEEQIVDYLVWREGTQETPRVWRWVTCPLQIEKSSGKINTPWSTLSEDGLLGETVEIVNHEKIIGAYNGVVS